MYGRSTVDTRAESRSTLACPSERTVAAMLKAVPKFRITPSSTPMPAYDSSERLGGRLIAGVRERPPEPQAVGTGDDVEGAAEDPGVSSRYAPAKRRSLRPPRDESVSFTGTSASRSRMVSAVACVKSRLV